MNQVIRRDVPVLLAWGFRPFFLLCAVHAVLALLVWLAWLFTPWQLPLGNYPLQWHSHEMLYGFVPAAAAGFVLTAMCNWTGASPLQGMPLLMLVLLWLAGRVAMAFAGALPGALVAAVNLAFLPVLAAYVAAVLWRHDNRRNLILVLVLALLTLGNALMHMGFINDRFDWLKRGEQLGFDVITVMMVVIAGRITPAFSGNWLRAHGGDPTRIRQIPTLERGGVLIVLVLLLAGLLHLPDSVTGSLALAAAVLHGARLYLWRGWQVRKEPLLWVLHLGYVWLVLALLLRGLILLGADLPGVVWQHMLGIGAMGTLIIGVMSRVALGHTGRPLTLPRFGVAMYWLVTLAVLARLWAALGWPEHAPAVAVSALAWASAFALFLVLYLPVLASPRADGRPG